MTRPRQPWEPDHGPRAIPFSQLHPAEQAAMKARLADVLSELQSAIPANEALARRQRFAAAEAARKGERRTTDA